MKNSALWITTLFLLTTCTTDEMVVTKQETPPDLLSVTAVNRTVRTVLDEQQTFSWSLVPSGVLWSALLHSDSVLSVGYQPVGETATEQKIAELRLDEPTWQNTKMTLLAELREVIQTTTGQPVSTEELLMSDNETLPYFEIKTTSYAALQYLRRHPAVRYVEPNDYRLQPAETYNQRTASKILCNYSNEQDVFPEDYQTVAPDAKVSWNFEKMQIAQAWSQSTGAGITVGLIDTGISPDQPKLGPEFNDGFSLSRTITKLGSYGDRGVDDECGHGTRMAGAILAPRGTTGTAVGVAYNANLVSYRGTEDVIIDAREEQRGVAEALVTLGNRPDVRIISMSVGNLLDSGPVADAVRYAYGKGKLICAAAGTSTSFTKWLGVVFPARMDETVAITGITDRDAYQRCDNCHSGSKVDFTMVMQREGTDRRSLTLPSSGSSLIYIGGSSVATAMTAGVAALVWSQNPEWNRAQVLQRIKESAELYPERDPEFGWGTINAWRAVGGEGTVAQRQ